MEHTGDWRLRNNECLRTHLAESARTTEEASVPEEMVPESNQ